MHLVMIMQIHIQQLLCQLAVPYPRCSAQPDLMLSTENECESVKLTSVDLVCMQHET